MDTAVVTTKIKRESLKKLKILAAATEEQMVDALERLIDAEFEKVLKGMQKRESDTRIQD